MNRNILAMLAAVAIATAAPALAVGAACSAKSGTQTAALIELYTSEGCDSCPPADRWLSGLKGSDAYAGRAVPLSLHVDYWDYIGWHDPYAQAQFSGRQHELSNINQAHMVYTPQILLSGKDFQPGIFSRGENLDDAVARINRAPPRADLGLTLAGNSGRDLKVEATARLRNTAESRDAALYLAVFENGLTSAVAAGENKGKTLKHDFVVREWGGPFAFNSDGTLAVTRDVALKPSWKQRDLGVALFVQNRSTGEVLQALQLAACN